MNRLSCVFVLLGSMVLAADSTLPAFEDYRLAEVSDLRLSAIDFDSHPDARNFRTRLEENLGAYANFAGHFILKLWGCGTMCQQIALIEVASGQVFMPEEFISSFGVCFKENSSLLIINPVDKTFIDDMDGELPAWFNIHYYSWNGSAAEHLLDSRQPVVEECDFF